MELFITINDIQWIVTYVQMVKTKQCLQWAATWNWNAPQRQFVVHNKRLKSTTYFPVAYPHTHQKTIWNRGMLDILWQTRECVSNTLELQQQQNRFLRAFSKDYLLRYIADRSSIDAVEQRTAVENNMLPVIHAQPRLVRIQTLIGVLSLPNNDVPFPLCADAIHISLWNHLNVT